jgi:hypothetical protein
VLVRLERSLSARNHTFDPFALARGDTSLEEALVDAEPRGEPLGRLVGRPGLPPLDLAHVFLREAVAGELGLREPLRDPQLAHPVSESRASGRGGGAVCGCQLITHCLSEVNYTRKKLLHKVT